MTKVKRKIFSLTFILAISIIFLAIKGIGINEGGLDIPKENEISSIQIYNKIADEKYHELKSDKEKSEIYKILSVCNNKNKVAESLNDVPTNTNKEIFKIILTDNSKNSTSIYIYQGNDDKYCVEAPYQGIYEISSKDYDILVNNLKISL